MKPALSDDLECLPFEATEAEYSEVVIEAGDHNPTLGRNFETMDPLEWLARMADYMEEATGAPVKRVRTLDALYPVGRSPGPRT